MPRMSTTTVVKVTRILPPLSKARVVENGDIPHNPAESLEGIQLPTVDEQPLRIAIQPAAQHLRNRRSRSGPHNPGKREAMRRLARAPDIRDASRTIQYARIR